MSYYNKKLNRFFIIIFVFLATFLFSFLPVNAVTVGPAKIEYRTDPGAIISDKLIILNEGQEDKTFYASFEKFIRKDGEIKFLPSEPAELAEWFKMKKSIVLKAGEQKEITYTIEVPKNAPPGGHFAVVWWGTASPSASKQVSIITRAGILVLLQVSGEINEKGEIIGFSLPGKKFLVFKLPEDFAVNFANQGNTYIKPKGEINIKNIFGSNKAVLGVNDVNVIFLPEVEQNLRVAKKFDKPPFAFGFYKAELALNWGEKQNSVLKSIWFFVFPWKHALGGIIILAVLFLGLKKAIKKYNQWIIGKHKNLENRI